MIVTRFYENMVRHKVEGRELAPGEKTENVVLEFDSQPPQEMLVACLWNISKMPTTALIYCPSPPSPTTHRPKSPPPATTAASFRSSRNTSMRG